MEDRLFVIHESLSEAELNDLVAATEADTKRHRAAIMRNDQIATAARYSIVKAVCARRLLVGDCE